MTIKHYLQFSDLTLSEYEYLIERARIIKQKFKNYEPYHPLQDRTLVMVFEKSSTRTRLSFEAGMHQLGGTAIYLNTRDSQLGRGEPIEDAAQVMSRMSDIIMVRTFGHDIIERFAAYSRVPVINGLTNEHHPCQVFADVFTFIEHRGSIKGKPLPGSGTPTTCCIPGCRRLRYSTSMSMYRHRKDTISTIVWFLPITAISPISTIRRTLVKERIW